MLDKLENMTARMISPQALEKAKLLVSGDTVRLMHNHTVPFSVFLM